MVGFAIVVLSACLLSLYHNYETICLLGKRKLYIICCYLLILVVQNCRRVSPLVSSSSLAPLL